MDSSSNTDDNNNDSLESPQPHKKRKISSQKTKSIHYATRSQSNKNNKYNKNNKNKRRLNNTNSSRNNKNKVNKNNKLLRYRDKVEPWWIGQRIIVQITDPKNKNINYNNKKSKHFTKIGREATIRDYNPKTQLSHIWFETEDNHFENVDLNLLEDWDIPNNKPIHKQIEFVPDNGWIPPKWKMKQRVLVKFDGKHAMGAQFAAFIDGYDPISRRHHINYGDTTEWIWARKQRVEIFEGKCDNYIEEKLKKFRKNRDEVMPPPWNPVPYGLDELFEIRSKDIHQSNQNNVNIESTRDKNINVIQPQNNKKQVKIFGNKTHPRRKLNNRVMANKVMTNGSQRTSSLMKKTKCISLNKLLKSNNSKLGSKTKNRITKQRRRLRRHSNTAQNKEKQESEDTVLDNNNDSVTSISSSESTFDTKTYQDTTDSDDDMKVRKQRTFEMKNSTKNNNIKTVNKNKKDDKHIQVSIVSNIPMSNNIQKSLNTTASSKKQPKKKKISLRFPKKAIIKATKAATKATKATNMNTKSSVTKTNNKQQTQAIPIHLQHIPITHSINTINTINTNINNTVSQPIVVRQIPTPSQLHAMMPITRTMPMFISRVQQQQQQQQRNNNYKINILQKPTTLILKKKKRWNNNKSQQKCVQEKRKLYPRTVIIKGEKWVRHYSRSDRKYYWLLHNDKNDIVDKEWDPWRKHGQKAPWMTSMQQWGKFKDPTEKKEYYYNYETKQSTFKRPKEFESDAEIQYDSADESHGKNGE